MKVKDKIVYLAISVVIVLCLFSVYWLLTPVFRAIIVYFSYLHWTLSVLLSEKNNELEIIGLLLPSSMIAVFLDWGIYVVTILTLATVIITVKEG